MGIRSRHEVCTLPGDKFTRLECYCNWHRDLSLGHLQTTPIVLRVVCKWPEKVIQLQFQDLYTHLSIFQELLSSQKNPEVYSLHHKPFLQIDLESYLSHVYAPLSQSKDDCIHQLFLFPSLGPSFLATYRLHLSRAWPLTLHIVVDRVRYHVAKSVLRSSREWFSLYSKVTYTCGRSRDLSTRT